MNRNVLQREVWVQFACAALALTTEDSAGEPISHEIAVSLACDLADAMTLAYERRFPGDPFVTEVTAP